MVQTDELVKAQSQDWVIYIADAGVSLAVGSHLAAQYGWHSGVAGGLACLMLLTKLTVIYLRLLLIFDVKMLTNKILLAKGAARG